MAFLPQVYNVPTFVSGSTFTSSVELPGAYLYMYLVVPTMSVGYNQASTPIFVQASTDNSTFYRYTNLDNTANTLVVGVNDFVIASSVSQRIIPLNYFGCRYLRLEISGTATGAGASPAPFKVICVSNQ